MNIRLEDGDYKAYAYRGFDEEKRVAVLKCLGTIDAFSFELSETLKANMTETEAAQLAEWLADRASGLESARQDLRRLKNAF